jgi:hypothetical protein
MEVNDMGYRHVHFQCRCSAPDHVLRATLYTDQDDLELSFQPYLRRPHSFWRRLWIAFRYVLGMNEASYWGTNYYCDVLLDQAGVEELTRLVAQHNLILKLKKLKKKSAASKEKSSMT